MPFGLMSLADGHVNRAKRRWSPEMMEKVPVSACLCSASFPHSMEG